MFAGRWEGLGLLVPARLPSPPYSIDFMLSFPSFASDLGGLSSERVSCVVFWHVAGCAVPQAVDCPVVDRDRQHRPPGRHQQQRRHAQE